MAEKQQTQKEQVSQGWLNSLETQGSITIYDPNLK